MTGDLDCLSVTEFLMIAAQAVDKRTEGLVLDLGGLTFLDAAGARALAMAAQFPPCGCPVIIRSLNARVRPTHPQLLLAGRWQMAPSSRAAQAAPPGTVKAAPNVALPTTPIGASTQKEMLARLYQIARTATPSL